MAHKSCKAKITNPYFSFVTIDEDIVTLDVSMYDRIGFKIMEIFNALKDLSTPRLNDLESWYFDFL